MKKAEVTPRVLITSFIIFTLLIMSGVFYMVELSKEDADFINNPKFISFNRTFSKYDNVTKSAEELKDKIEKTNSEKGIWGVLDSLINSGWNTIKSIFTTFSFITDALGGISAIFGLPAWVGSLIVSLIIIVFAFSLYSLIFQGKT